jgi:DNA-binding transcriptional MerR regulator
MPDPKSRRLEPARKYAERHGVTVRTVDRWVEKGVVDPPIRIRNRKYFEEGTEPRLDQQNTETAI